MLNINQIILYYQAHTSKRRLEEVEKEVKAKYGAHIPISLIVPENKNSVNFFFDEAIKQVKYRPTNLLIIAEMEYFEKESSIRLLKKLSSAKSKFQVLNFEYLNLDNIDSFIQYYIFKYHTRKQDVKIGQEKAVAKGKKIGSPKTLKRKTVQRKAEIERRRSSLLNQANINARKKVYELREEKKETFASIAEYLNRNGYLTRRGSKFNPSTTKRLHDHQKELQSLFNDDQVKRLYEEQKKLNENFSNRDLDKVSTPLFGVRKEILLKEDIIDEDISEIMELNFKDSIKDDLHINIINSRKEEIYNGKIEQGSSSLEIDMLKDTFALPGVHYLKISGKNYNNFIRRFFFRRDLHLRLI